MSGRPRPDRSNDTQDENAGHEARSRLPPRRLTIYHNVLHDPRTRGSVPCLVALLWRELLAPVQRTACGSAGAIQPLPSFADRATA
jgi:hypothetical protein